MESGDTALDQSPPANVVDFPPGTLINSPLLRQVFDSFELLITAGDYEELEQQQQEAQSDSTSSLLTSDDTDDDDSFSSSEGSSSSSTSSSSSRCPDGYHRSPSGDCERVTDTRGMPRCPDGYHRSPDGDCEYAG